MSETTTLTIAFRGLMIFHEDRQNKLMEIGLLPTAGHIPRILTITNGVLADVFDLRIRTELNDETKRIWRINVTDPVTEGIQLRTSGSSELNRLTHKHDTDYRWIMDFEAQDFYDEELTNMRTQKLMPVIQVPVGEFYTLLKTPLLNRRKDKGELEPFGSIAGVTGCDIMIDGGGVELTAVNGGTSIFHFKDPNKALKNTIYEITNTPPDVTENVPGEAPHDHGGHHPAHQHDDHFQNYYNLFDEDQRPHPIFGFRPQVDGAPSPSPALCGKGSVGKRTTPIGG